MKILVKIYSAYALTYSKVYMDILKKIYGTELPNYSVELEIEDISKNKKGESLSIQSQRSLSAYVTRTVRIFEDGVLRYIIAMSNTCYDYDRDNEYKNGLSKKSKNTFGISNYHGNSFIKQGSPDIFNYYYDEKEKNPNVKLMFYILDIAKSHPHNLFNVLSYRELETIGFKVLNIDEIDFSKYEKECNSKLNRKNISFASLNKYIHDIAKISSKNKGNNPSYLTVNEYEVLDENGDMSYMTEKYIYTFKSLSAQSYDSLFKCWCLKTLAKRENVEIEFKLGKQYFAYQEKDKKIAEKLPKTVKKTLEKAGIDINYVTDESFMTEIKFADNTYLKHKTSNDLRNQSLFRNNMRKTGIPMECSLCGEDNVSILDAAHIWEVSKIKDASNEDIDNFIKDNELFSLIDENSQYKDEIFFKKYSLVNSGENGIWLCKNHHGLFDKNYYCFDSKDGKILLHFNDAAEAQDFSENIKPSFKLPDIILTDERRAFISQRQLYFAA